VSQPQKLGANLRERAAHGGHGLDLRGAQLGRDLLLAQSLPRPPQHGFAAGAQPAGLGGYDLVFLLDPEGVFFRRNQVTSSGNDLYGLVLLPFAVRKGNMTNAALRGVYGSADLPDEHARRFTVLG
jgi:hypothetical protein